MIGGARGAAIRWSASASIVQIDVPAPRPMYEMHGCDARVHHVNATNPPFHQWFPGVSGGFLQMDRTDLLSQVPHCTDLHVLTLILEDVYSGKC